MMVHGTRKRFWRDFTSAEIAALDRENTIVVLPLAAIEQHGPHLPLSVDTTIIEGLIDRVQQHLAEDAQVVFLPVCQVGKSNEHASFPGTLTLSAETLTRVWMELGDAVAACDLRRLVLFNSHGGQTALLDVVARDLRTRHGMFVAKCSWYQFGLPEGIFDATETRHGIHGGDVETSMMLALAPDLDQMDRAANFVALSAELEAEFPLLMRDDGGLFGWKIEDLNPQCAAGNAARASAAKGHQVLDFAARRFAELLMEVGRFPLARLGGASRTSPPPAHHAA